jgi:PKD repeat protein
MDANFTADPELGVAPLIVQFTDLSSGDPTEWSWTFGDGGVSTLQNPEYTYTTPGTYTVTLTVIGPGGSDVQEMVNLIFVQYPAPIADFSGDPTGGVAPLDVNFISLSTGEIDSYFWDFGDGGSSTEQNPDYIYEEPGIYNVTLTIVGPGGSDEMVKENYITVVEPAQVVITSFVGSSEVSFITLEEWFATFTQENGESATILSSLSNQYSVDFENGTVSIISLTTAGLDILTLTVTGPTGEDEQTLEVMVYTDHNPLSDTIGSQDIEIYTSPVSANPDEINFQLQLPLQSFYELYDFSFDAAGQGAGIQNITFAANSNILTIDVICNTTSNSQSFSIIINESGNLWFQTGVITLLPNQATLEMLSADISEFVYPGDELITKIFTGTPTNWVFTNETYNEIVYTDTHTATGITEKTVTVGWWTLGPIVEQTIRIDVSNATKTVGRTFLMDGTTGVINLNNEVFINQIGRVFPNPANGRATLTFSLSQKSAVVIQLIDMQGKVINTIVNQKHGLGHHEVSLSTTGLPEGVYLLKMVAGGYSGTSKLTKLQ